MAKSIRLLLFGLLAALYCCIVPATNCESGAVLQIDGREFKEVKPARHSAIFSPTQAEKARGFSVFQTEEPTAITEGFVPDNSELVHSFHLFAAPGQYEPIVFGIYALRPLKRLEISISNFEGPSGAVIDKSAVDLRLGRYIIQRTGYTELQYHIVPKLLEKNHSVEVMPERPQLCWITLHVPDNSPSGRYRTCIHVQGDGAPVLIPVELRVLPFELARGKPWMLYYYESDPADAELHFRDMREHGMTSVILAQVNAPLQKKDDNLAAVDFAGSDAFVEAYRKAGFTDPLIYNPFHDRLATRLLEVFGLADRYPREIAYGENICIFKEQEYPAFLRETYKQVVNDIIQHARKTDWPPTLLYLVDEPNNVDSWRMTAARMEYRLAKEALPSVRTFCTVYSIPAMENLDPFLDARACTMDYLGQGEVLQSKLKKYLKNAGGEIWGIDWPAMWDDFWRARELGGFLPAKLGLKAMTAWTYYKPRQLADEYGDLRGESKQCLLVYKDSRGELAPTVTWEGLRAGITDWRYVITLEEALAKSDGAKRERGMQALNEILSEVPWLNGKRTTWTNNKARELRRRIADTILSL
jgi:hypothetical protein